MKLLTRLNGKEKEKNERKKQIKMKISPSYVLFDFINTVKLWESWKWKWRFYGYVSQFNIEKLTVIATNTKLISYDLINTQEYR